jgi:hypothetical protein
MEESPYDSFQPNRIVCYTTAAIVNAWFDPNQLTIAVESVYGISGIVRGFPVLCCRPFPLPFRIHTHLVANTSRTTWVITGAL